jgi:mRNA-degrading endonuclease toxin of MazEF toxin-antitoxin module
VISDRPRRGQLYFAELEEIGRKLVLVVSANDVNNVLAPVVCLVTATNRERALPTFVTLYPPEGGVWKSSAILCHALVTLDLWRLAADPIGVVSSQTMDQVDQALARALGLSASGLVHQGNPAVEGDD